MVFWSRLLLGLKNQNGLLEGLFHHVNRNSNRIIDGLTLGVSFWHKALRSEMSEMLLLLQWDL